MKPAAAMRDEAGEQQRHSAARAAHSAFPYRLVIFDLDGTLVDTAPEITDALNTYLRQRHLHPAPLEEVRGWIGHGARELLRRALASRGAGEPDASGIAAFDRIYRAHCGSNASRPYPGVPETLARLRAAGVRLAVMTNKERAFALPVLAAHRLTEYFDDIVCGDTLPARKPDPLPVRHCLDRAGVAAAQALVVGDSTVDVATARAAGVAIWLVEWGYDPAAQSQADRVIGSFRALVA